MKQWGGGWGHVAPEGKALGDQSSWNATHGRTPELVKAQIKGLVGAAGPGKNALSFFLPFLFLLLLLFVFD